MKNIELKISLSNFEKIVSTLKKIGAKFENKLDQIDTYYNCKNDRLKIREINNQNFELIYYQRPNKNGSKISDYEILNIESKQLNILKAILNTVLREIIVIEKKRSLWMYNNTRIHLDEVKGLGKFLELETVVKKSSIINSRKEHNELIGLLSLSEYKKINQSYLELAQNLAVDK